MVGNGAKLACSSTNCTHHLQRSIAFARANVLAYTTLQLLQAEMVSDVARLVCMRPYVERNILRC